MGRRAEVSGKPGDLPESPRIQNLRGEVEDSKTSKFLNLQPNLLSEFASGVGWVFCFKINTKMKMKILLIFTLLTINALAQNVVLEVKVINENKTPVRDAIVEVYQLNNKQRSATDSLGFSKLSVKIGDAEITIKHLSYQQYKGKLKINTDTLLIIQLSTRLIKFNEVTITATGYSANTVEVSNFVEIIDEVKIDKISPTSFSDILKIATSIYIRDYGGTPAQLKTISLRGTGSEHTVFLLNGVRISSLQNGVFDLSLLPVDAIERIELIHSNMSSLYGADAIGGVVNVITKRKNEFTEFNIATGSFGTRKFNFNFSGSVKNFNYLASFTRNYGTGNFNYKYKLGNDEITLNRKNAHFNISDFYINFSNQSISFSTLYFRSTRGIPAPTTKFDPSSTATQFDEDINLSLSITRPFTSSILKANFLFKNSLLKYTNNDIIIAGSGISSYSHNFLFSGIITYLFKANFDILLVPGLEVSFGTASGNSFERAKRLNTGLFLTAEKKFESKALPTTRIYTMLRNDRFSDFGNKFIYKLGVNSEIFKNPALNLKFSYGTGFRAPTFNDLYWYGSGNKNLKPETSKSYDFGFVLFSESARKFIKEFKFEVSIFNIDITNRIVWLPLEENQNLWKPVNIDEVNSRGIEFSGEIAISRFLKLSGNFSISQSIRKNKRFIDDATQNKQLIYIPRSTGNLLIDLSFDKIFLSVQTNYVGLRYTTETNDRWLQPFIVIDAVLGFKYQIKSFSGAVKFSIKNLFNENYETIVGYPMPLRNYLVEFSMQIKNQTKTKR